MGILTLFTGVCCATPHTRWFLQFQGVFNPKKPMEKQRTSLPCVADLLTSTGRENPTIKQIHIHWKWLLREFPQPAPHWIVSFSSQGWIHKITCDESVERKMELISLGNEAGGVNGSSWARGGWLSWKRECPAAGIGLSAPVVSPEVPEPGQGASGTDTHCSEITINYRLCNNWNGFWKLWTKVTWKHWIENTGTS